MMRRLTCYCSVAALVAGAGFAGNAMADEQRIADLEERLEALEADPATGDGIRFGGALRFNARYDDTDSAGGQASRDSGGDIDFDTFRVNVDGRQDNITFAAEYRWYDGRDFLHTGWVGYDFTDTTTVRLGQQRVAFGLQPYQSNNFWFSGNYYVGFEDKHAIGLALDHQSGPLSIDAGVFTNPPSGLSDDNAHYSTGVGENTGAPDDEDAFDTACDEDEALCHEEQNQFYARAAYTFEHNANASTEVGLSGMYGELYNNETRDEGDSTAYALHVNGQYDRWNIMAQYLSYEHDPDVSDGVSDEYINMSIEGFNYAAPAEADVVTLNIAYDLPVEFGPVSNLRFYNDYSTIRQKSTDDRSSALNVTGMAITAGNIYTYVDVIRGKNMPFVGAQGYALQGDSDVRDDWETIFNINVGYYF